MHQIAARSLTEPCRVNLLSYCPTMDLIATVTPAGYGSGQTAKDIVDVWRLNGQRVFGATFESADDHDGTPAAARRHEGGRGSQTNDKDKEKERGFVRALSWRRDGQLLAVGCADGTLSLINAFTGKIAHRLSARCPALPGLSTAATSLGSSQSSHTQTANPGTSGPKSTTTQSKPVAQTRAASISCLSWTKHFIFPNASTIRSRLRQPDTGVSLDQILGLKADMENMLKFTVNLPQGLTDVDVEDSLPKLATLPPLGAAVDDDVFSSRASVDAIFHQDGSAGQGDGAVDVLLSGITTEEGGCGVDVKILNSFEIGSINLEGPLQMEGQHQLVRMDSHPFLSTVFLVVAEFPTDQDRPYPTYHLVSLDLNFIPQTGRYLVLVARKATMLGNLLRYITQIHMQLASEVKAAFDLPSRFLRNINEFLAEEDQDANFLTAATHLLATGDCRPRLREWLVDEVGERGPKRWEKAVGDCLDLVCRMVGENLMPALERFQVSLSRLEGLARYGPVSSKTGLEQKDVIKIQETVDALTLFAEDLLNDVGIETKEFTAFMKWMKFECEVEALEATSERAEELRESYTGENELPLVLDYVNGVINDSRLNKYIASSTDDIGNGRTEAMFNEDTTTGFYADYIERRNSGKKPMPSLGDLVARLDEQCHVLFRQIADNFRKSILTSHLLVFPDGCDGQRMDIRIIPAEEREGGAVPGSLYHLVALSKDCLAKDRFRVVRVPLRLEDGKKPVMEQSDNAQRILTNVEDCDEVLDAKFVDDRSFLLLLSFPNDTRVGIYHCEFDDDGRVMDDMKLRHYFPGGRMHAGMRAARLEVNGREGRRAVTVIDEAARGYLVLDIDSDSEDENSEGNDGDDVMTT
ncbi:hypothetical protein HRR82_000247 [Exophiala dermatitidis]|nr:hypothetical protein HRR82_000247 [Exophiala dermatitidis]